MHPPLLIALAVIAHAADAAEQCANTDNLDVATIAKALAKKKYVDLTHAFHPGNGDWATMGEIPHFSAFPGSTRERLFTTHPSVYPHIKGTKGGGFFAELFCHVGQWGTHVDPPVHFVPNARALDKLMPEEMVLPLVVIDMSAKASADWDAELSVEDILAFEAEHGIIPEGSFVALRTDIHKFWDTGKLHREGEGGKKSYPNWGLPALKFLYEQRRVKASGHEATDTDRGICAGGASEATCNDWALRKETVDAILTRQNLTIADLGGEWTYGFANEFYVLSRDTYQIELLKNLDQLPATGSMIVASWPNAKDGSGFPARVFAIVDP